MAYSAWLLENHAGSVGYLLKDRVSDPASGSTTVVGPAFAASLDAWLEALAGAVAP